MADPRWDEDPTLVMEGDGGGGNVVGFPVDFYFEESEYGPRARILVRRSHPELNPAGKVEVGWTYNIAGERERPNWSIVDNGARIVHVDGKQINQGVDLGKLFKSVKAHLPYVEGFDPRDAKSWKGLESLGDIEFGWIEEPKRMPDPADPLGKKWIVDPSKDPKRTMVVVGYSGEGAANGVVADFDLSTIPADLLPDLQAAVAGVPANDKTALFAALGTFPKALNVQAVTGALSSDATAEALRLALTGGVI